MSFLGEQVDSLDSVVERGHVQWSSGNTVHVDLHCTVQGHGQYKLKYMLETQSCLPLPALEIFGIAVLVAKLLEDRLDARVVPVLTNQEKRREHE